MEAALDPSTRRDTLFGMIDWSSVIVGALVTAALSFILLSFGAAVGLGVSSSAPTWRDASAALWLLSGLYLIIQALVSFGVGSYVASRLRNNAGLGGGDEESDGLHGLAV